MRRIFEMRGSKSVNEGKRDRQRGAAFGKGGNTRMFGKQAAGPDKPGTTGKDQTAAPGR